MKSHWLDYAGKRILYIDLANLGDDIPAFDLEITGAMKDLGPEMFQKPENSVLVLVDVRNTSLSQQANKLLSERIVDTKKYVAKTAVVGMTGVRRFFLDYFARLAGSDTEAFDESETAKDWLVKAK
jgi:hypothetical protein